MYLGKNSVFQIQLKFLTQNFSKSQPHQNEMANEKEHNLFSHNFDINLGNLDKLTIFFQNELSNCKVLFYLLLNPEVYRISVIFQKIKLENGNSLLYI